MSPDYESRARPNLNRAYCLLNQITLVGDKLQPVSDPELCRPAGYRGNVLRLQRTGRGAGPVAGFGRGAGGNLSGREQGFKSPNAGGTNALTFLTSEPECNEKRSSICGGFTQRLRDHPESKQ
jgi:hypothetical protein